MKFMVTGRAHGKTSTLVEWVKQGEPTDSYPFWTRVILCPDFRQAQQLRMDFDLEYRQVFGIDEWKRARLGARPVELAIDNVDLFLEYELGGGIKLVTATGESYTW